MILKVILSSRLSVQHNINELLYGHCVLKLLCALANDVTVFFTFVDFECLCFYVSVSFRLLPVYIVIHTQQMHTDRVFAVRRFSNVRPNTMLSIALKMT